MWRARRPRGRALRARKRIRPAPHALQTKLRETPPSLRAWPWMPAGSSTSSGGLATRVSRRCWPSGRHAAARHPAYRSRHRTWAACRAGGSLCSATLPQASRLPMGDSTSTSSCTTTPSRARLKTDIKFTPSKTAPYTNKLGLVQIIRDRDETGADIDIASLPPTSGPGLRTAEDKKAGVEGGFFTDVLHRDFGVTPNVDRKKGEAVGSYYQGGSPVFGFRRSGNPADIKAAETTDDPGTTNPKASRNFAFETVAKGDDNLLTYGALK